MEPQTNYFKDPESSRWRGGGDVICGSPVKVKQTRKQHTSYEDVLKEFKYSKYCTPPPFSSCKPPPKSSEKLCLCAPTKHAGSFRCRLHRAPIHSYKQSASNNLKPSGLSKVVKDTQLDQDIESPLPVMED